MGDAEDVKRKMIDAISKFEVDFVKAKLSTEVGGPNNVCVSAYSVWNALFLLYLGAENETKVLMEEVLGVSELRHLDKSILYSAVRSLHEAQKSNTEVQLEVLNKLFFDVSAGVDLVRWKTQVHDDLEVLDFKQEPRGSTDHINSWVEKGTRGKIPRVFDSDLPRSTVLVLTNTVYFKAMWQSVFQSFATQNGDFFLSSGEKVSVPFMHDSDRYPVFDSDDLGATLISLPYRDARYSFVIMLPYVDNSKEALPASEHAYVMVHSRTQTMEGLWRGLTRDKIQSAVRQLQRVKSQLSLPKFKTEFKCNLKETLTKMNLGSIFDEKCDFSSFTGSKIRVSEAVHKTFIEVNEDGTEAAAVTAMPMCGCCLDLTKDRLLNVNRPFYFMVYDNEFHTALFSGIVASPS